MYIPTAFSETDPQVLADLIARYPLGMLVTAGSLGLWATPVPFRLRREEGRSTLVAHLARANPHLNDLTQVLDCLVMFQGAQNYVTPSWYATKATTHKVVPTWNYEVVQVRGVPRVVDGLDWLKTQVGELVEGMERPRDIPWSIEDAPQDFIATQLKAIVGLEIEILSIQGKWKMSQNRPPEDVQGVVTGLSDPDDPHTNPEVAGLVASRAQRPRRENP